MKIDKIDTTSAKTIQDMFCVSPLCAKVLSAMELDDTQLLSLFKETPSLQTLDVSFLTPILNRLYQAKVRKEKVLVCGDYDCDGICATTIMYDALNRYGIDAGYYIPNRFEEGYGLHVNTVHLAKEKGYTLLITVDNGVKAKEALTLAKSFGIEVILTDHHSYVEEELICDYFLHPQILAPMYQNMCGAGIAYLIAKGLIGSLSHHVILAGIATIGDIVPLWHVNRILVKECISLLNQGQYQAFQLLQNDRSPWDAKKIAFQIVPKLNSVGRLADRANVNTIVRFLLCEDLSVIESMVKQLNALNRNRKRMSEDMEEIADALLNEQESFQILYDERFHEGMNGIVASKYTNRLMQPVMVLSDGDDILKGSIRSNSVDLTHFFDELDDLLLSYGGHKQAAGISFYKKDLAAVRLFVKEKMQKVKQEELRLRCLVLPKEELSVENWQTLSVLEPFGCAFEMPLIYVEEKGVIVSSMSNGKHVKYRAGDRSYLYFNQGDRLQRDQNKTQFAFIGKFEINHFLNRNSLNMIVDYLIDLPYNKNVGG